MNNNIDPAEKTNTGNIQATETSWIAENVGIVKYFFYVLIAVALILSVCFGYLFNTPIYAEYLEAVTRGASRILTALGEPNIIIKNDTGGIEGRILGGWETDVVVDKAAGGLLIALCLGAAIIFWPASWLKKMSGILFGTALALSTNVLRIVASLLADLYYPLQFELLSSYAFPILHASAAIVFFMIWAWWSDSHPSD